MGFGSSGREAKGHDRRTQADPFKKKADAPVQTTTAPPLPLAERRPESMIDCGASLLSRSLSTDQGRMLGRATSAGVDGILVFTRDWERLNDLHELVKLYPGFLYGVYGLSPDNVKRPSEKFIESRLAELRTLGLAPECVGLLGGLDFTREAGSHFAQERVLDGLAALAAELHLPLVLTELGASERMAEKVTEYLGKLGALPEVADVLPGAQVAPPEPVAADEVPGQDSDQKPEPEPGPEPAAVAGALPQPPVGAAPSGGWDPRVAIFAFDGGEPALSAYVAAGTHIVLTGAICDQDEKGAALRALVPAIPLPRLLLASNSPSSTPAVIADFAIRTSRNEPSNLPEVLPTLTAAWNAALPESAPGWADWVAAGRSEKMRPRLTVSEMVQTLFDNSALFFGLRSRLANELAPDAAAAAGAAEEEEHGDGGGGDDGEEEDEENDEEEKEDEEVETAGGDCGRREGGHGVGADGKPKTEAAGAAEAAGATDPVDATGASDAAPAGGAAPSGPSSIVYHCRMCRAKLFSDENVMPHDGSGVRPSKRAVALGAVAVQGGYDGAGDGDGGDVGGGAKHRKGRKTGGGKQRQDKDEGGADEVVEVGVGRWHTAKGRSVRHRDEGGGCRMLLLDKLPWMAASVTAGGDEGSLLCPGCSCKLGQYSVAAPLKCSCGIEVTPAFKVSRARLDEVLLGVDVLEMALAAATLDAAPAAGDAHHDGDADERQRASKKASKKGLKVPVTKQRGNFSVYRDSKWVKPKKVGKGAAAAAATATTGGGRDEESDEQSGDADD